MSRFAPFIPREHKIGPREGDPGSPTEDRIDQIAEILSGIPISVFSTNTGPNSRVTAAKGTLGIEQGNNDIRLWYANKDGNSDWIPLAGGTPEEGEGDSDPPELSLPSHSHSKSELPSTIAYEDEENQFSEKQQIETFGEPALRVQTVTDDPSIQIAAWEGRRASAASADEIFHSFFMRNSSGATTEIGRLTYEIVDATSGSETGAMLFEVERSGSLEEAIAIRPDEIIVNESGSSRSFRVEGQNDPSAFVVEGVDGMLGMGTDMPHQTVHLKKNNPAFRFEDSMSGVSMDLQLTNSGLSVASDLTKFIEVHPTSGTSIFERLDVGEAGAPAIETTQLIKAYRDGVAINRFDIEQSNNSFRAGFAARADSAALVFDAYGSKEPISLDGISLAGSGMLEAVNNESLIFRSRTTGPIRFFTNDLHRGFIEGDSQATFQWLSDISATDFLSGNTLKFRSHLTGSNASISNLSVAASPIEVTGARNDSEAALANFLTAAANLGFIIDSTTSM